jgi:glucose/arabinose dehydrogenase
MEGPPVNLTKPRLLTLIITVLLALAVSCGGDNGGSDGNGGEVDTNPLGLEKQLVAEAPDAVAITFAPDGRIFFAEKYTGRIRIIDAAGNLVSQPFAEIDVATWLDYQGTAWGLTGLALDPDFETNGYVYAFFTQTVTENAQRPTARPVLVRFTDENNVGTERTEIISDFPETRLDHQGFKTNGDLQFGPDGALYMSVGDFDWGKEGPEGEAAAQDLSFPGGKVLRVNSDGTPHPDNPFADEDGADPRVFALGFAHGSPLAFHPDSDDLYTSDANDSCEEIDIVEAGNDYGWPDVGEFPFSDCTFGDQVDPVALLARDGTIPGQFQSVVGVSGLSFVSGDDYPIIGDSLLVCGALDGIMRRVILATSGRSPAGSPITTSEIVVRDCDRDVAVSPDGTIYYSNKTTIFRLLPPPGTTGATTSPTASPTR